MPPQEIVRSVVDVNFALNDPLWRNVPADPTAISNVLQAYLRTPALYLVGLNPKTVVHRSVEAATTIAWTFNLGSVESYSENLILLGEGTFVSATRGGPYAADPVAGKPDVIFSGYFEQVMKNVYVSEPWIGEANGVGISLLEDADKVNDFNFLVNRENILG